MNGISNVNASAPADVGSQADYLTPEALLAYCTSRLDSIDESIKARFAEQQTRNDALKGLNRLADLLDDWPWCSAKAEGPNVADGHIGMAGALHEVWSSNAHPDVKKLAAEKYAIVTGMGIDKAPMKDGKFDPAGAVLDKANIKGLDQQQWAQQVNSVKPVQDSLSKDNEIAMIGLQSMLSQRQLAVQLTTQMMSAMNEGYKGIIANLRG